MRVTNDKEIKNGHYSVMMNESIESLNLKVGDVVVDCTVNRGGHALEIAKKIGPKGTLIMFDLDKTALRETKEKFERLRQNPKLYFIHSNYRNIKNELEKIQINEVDKIFADFGLSSEELEISGRGFSFQKDEPLYMTFNSEIDNNTFTAKDLIQNLSAANLEKIFQVYGGEKKAWKIANAIVSEREKLNEKRKQIDTTKKLVEIVESVSKRVGKAHPATKIFQAIRIAVNDEYEGIKNLITDGYKILKNGGIMSILTFHSGEDRIVKNAFKGLGKNSKQKPSRKEVVENKRSRSAMLRTIIK